MEVGVDPEGFVVDELGRLFAQNVGFGGCQIEGDPEEIDYSIMG